jgi:hypothetical protein
MVVNRGWLKHSAWDIFDEDICLEHVNISDIPAHGYIIYMFDNNAKILRC